MYIYVHMYVQMWHLCTNVYICTLVANYLAMLDLYVQYDNLSYFWVLGTQISDLLKPRQHPNFKLKTSPYSINWECNISSDRGYQNKTGMS